MKLESVIFDLDGTILDTLEDLKSSVNFALEKNGLPLRTTQEIRAFVGNGIRRLIERAVPANTESHILENCFLDFKEHYKEHSADNTKPYEGIISVLEYLKGEGIKLAVVSNKADFAVQNLIEEYFPGIFHYAVGEKDGIRRKPCPDSVNDAIKNLGVSKEKAIYVGDSEVDIETARNTGVECIAVTWGFRDKYVLECLGPEYIIDKPSQLTEILVER